MKAVALSMGLLLAAAAPGAAAQDTPPPAHMGHLKGTKIQVADLQRSIGFYSEMFGFRVARTIAQGPSGAINEVILTINGKFDLGGAPWLVLEGGLLRDAAGNVLAPVAQIRVVRSFQLGSSSKALALELPGKKLVIARGTPFGDSVDELEAALLARFGLAR